MPLNATTADARYRTLPLYSLRIATWNVRTLNTESKPKQLARRLQQYNIDICCITEVRWPHSGMKDVGGWKLGFPGRDDGQLRQGVGVMLSPRAAAAYIDSQPISEGVLLVKLRLKSSTLCVICACAPTNDYPAEQKDAFFVGLQHAIDRVGARITLVLAGDSNAQVGAEDPQQWHGCLENFALKKKSMRTSGMALRLLDFCVAKVLALRNTFFNHKDIHLATWTGPGDRNANQIDILVMRRTQAKAMLNCRVHSGAELDTDHYLLVGSCRLQLSQPRTSQPKPRGGYDYGLLQDAIVQKKYAVMISDKSHHLCSMVSRPDSTPEALWQQYKSGLQRCADALLRREHHGCLTRRGPACKVSKTPKRPLSMHCLSMRDLQARKNTGKH